jgi:hypothetical protein
MWGILVLTAIGVLTVYSMTPGDIESPPMADSVGIPVDDSEFTLVMAVHPRCACTRASVEQLERLLARFHDRLKAHVFLFHPGQASVDWAQTDVRNSLQRLSNVTLLPDPDGRQATQIGCLTSGSVVLYDQNGRPRFWGGITLGRGHSGDNPGSDHVAAVLRGETKETQSTPVFGCSLRSVQLSSNLTDEERSAKR